MALLIRFIGVDIDRRHREVTINRFNGSRPIAELPVYPERFAENAETKRKERVERGRKYLDLLSRGGAHRMYSGFLSYHTSDPYLRQDHRHVRSQSRPLIPHSNTPCSTMGRLSLIHTNTSKSKVQETRSHGKMI